MFFVKLRKRIRAKRIGRFYKDYLKTGDKVLDIGCGSGGIMIALQHVLGIKLDLTGTDLVDYSPPFKIKLIKNKGKLPFKDKEFDTTMLNGVLHHVPYQEQMRLIKEAIRVSNKVLIEEFPNTFSTRVIDVITNKIADTNADLTLSMRNLEEWISIFKQNNFKFRYGIIGKSFIHPVENFYFVIDGEEG